MVRYTFLIPAFKVSFFAETLDSIRNQKFKDFKVIVSDDCSNEDLKSVFDKIVGSDTRFSYRRNSVNMGSKSLVGHWNLLVDMCDTEYMIMASDDDVYEPTFLGEIDDLVNKYPHVNLLRARVRVINEQGEVTGEDPVAVDYENQVDFLFRTFVHRRFKCIANYVFKTSSLREKGAFEDFPLAWGSDDITVMKTSEQGVCITPSVLFSFRLSGKNISSICSCDKSIKSVRARIQNIQFFERYAPTIKTDGSILASVRLNSFKSFYFKEWSEQIKNGCEYLPYAEMKSAYIFLKSRGYMTGTFDKLHLFWTWFKARGKR